MARAVSYMRREPFHITFDRPFTWAIEDAPTGPLLFVGRVLHPTARSEWDALCETRPAPGQAPRPIPRPGRAQRSRAAVGRRGDGLRGLLRQRVDPLPPLLAVPREGGGRLRADHPRGMGARDPRAPAHAHDGAASAG